MKKWMQARIEQGKRAKNQLAVAAGLGLAVGVAQASPTGPDLSSLTGAVVVGTVTAAILAVHATKIVPKIAAWGASMVSRLFGRG
jgi:hypothetical protein